MNRPRCHHVLLARNAIGKMDYCAACRVVTLHVGVVSLRFDPAAIEAVWSLLAEGLGGLHAELAEQPVHRRTNVVS
jgi:hypothetical protein